MADAGARKISGLLDADSVRLKMSNKRLVKALAESPGQTGGVPPAIAFAALDDMRRFFRTLRDKVAKVDTSSSAKDDVLDALARLDLGYQTFEQALHEGIDEDGNAAVKKASRLIKRAAKDVRKARERLT